MELRGYQIDALDFCHQHANRALIAYPPGTGKTVIGSRFIHRSPGPILVVAPNGPVLHHWQRTLHDDGLQPSVLCAGTKPKRAAQRELIADSVAHVLVINYECMRGDIEELLSLGFETLIFDESHRLKNHRSLTYKAAIRLARRAENVLLLSGTPILNRAEEMWTSLALLKPGKYKSYWRWIEANFEVSTVRRGSRWVREIGPVKFGRQGAVFLELQTIMLSGDLKTMLPQLPPVTETTLEVVLSAPERKAYESMKQKLWAELGGKLLTAANISGSKVKLRQMCSDWTVYADTLEPGAKVRQALELINDTEEQWVVFCGFRGAADALARQHPTFEAFHGGMSADQRSRAIHRFIQGDAKVIVGTLHTMGEGIDGLQCARNIIMLDRAWTPALNEQAIGRCLRSGQTRGVNVVHLVAQDTTDQRVAEALAQKQDVIDMFTGTKL